MAIERITPNDQGSSPDLVASNIDQLIELFPEIEVDGRIDTSVLLQLIGEEADESDEQFGLNWHGKRRARQLALTPSTGTLRPAPEDSVDWDTTQHLMIEGDNLEVLKLLQKSYAGRVKLIYIDPPYNTGNDFVYRDDFRDNIANYLEVTGQTEEGRKASTNTEASGRFHTDWLNMMYPRLKLARQLLSDDGILLVSMNDNEDSNLRLLLNEVLGEENFVCKFVWNNEGNVDQQSRIKGVHEYVICYARNVELLGDPSVIDPNVEEGSKLYNDTIENSITKIGPANPPSEVLLPAGFPAVFNQGTIAPRDDKWPHILDEVVVADGQLQKPARVYSGWSSRNLLELFTRNGCVNIQDSEGKETWFSLTESGAIYGYKRRSELQGHVLSVIRNVGTTKQNSSMLKSWGLEFSYPKPLLLIQYLVRVFVDPNDNGLVVDFFAGSGTTGHAVMAKNAEDGGHRRYVLVQLPEETANGDLTELTKERLRRAAAKIRKDHPDYEGDLGFRVFKLDSSNIRAWDPQPEDLEETLLEHVSHLKEDRSEQHVLYELLLKLGLDLCVPTETQSIANKTVHSIGAGTLFACLDETLEADTAEDLALGIIEWRDQLDPAGDTTVVFRDSAFPDDVTKTNTDAILKQHDITNVRSI